MTYLFPYFNIIVKIIKVSKEFPEYKFAKHFNKTCVVSGVLCYSFAIMFGNFWFIVINLQSIGLLNEFFLLTGEIVYSLCYNTIIIFFRYN